MPRIDRLTEDDVPAGPLLTRRDLQRIEAAEAARDEPPDSHDIDRAQDRYERGLGW